jgi:hypothetical protein
MRESKHIIKILNINQLTHDVKEFITTKPKDYKFTPGQATELAINQEGFKDRFHPFTFTSLPEEKHLEFAIKSYPIDKYPDHSGVTEKTHQLMRGDEFIIKNPVGTIEYQKQGVFLAGGAGITPFIAIFKDLKESNKLEDNKLIFSNKTKKDVIIESELKKWFDDNDLILTLTREKKEGYENGRIDKKMIDKYINDFNQHFYICGPSSFENSIIKALLELGAQEEKTVVEEW